MATDVNIIEGIASGRQLPPAVDLIVTQSFDMEQQSEQRKEEQVELPNTLNASDTDAVHFSGDDCAGADVIVPLDTSSDLLADSHSSSNYEILDDSSDGIHFATNHVHEHDQYQTVGENVDPLSGNDQSMDDIDWKTKYILEKLDYEKQLEQINSVLMQKQSANTLLLREKSILEKEKEEFRKEMDAAKKEKESTIIKFAMKEIQLLESAKEKETLDKNLDKARKEIKLLGAKVQALGDEKNRLSTSLDEKNREIRKHQLESEKLKTNITLLESELKYYTNKLNMEVEARKAVEKKLAEEPNAQYKLEEKAFEKLKVESEAQRIMLRHEINCKNEEMKKLTQESRHLNDSNKKLQQQIRHEFDKHVSLTDELHVLQAEHKDLKQSYDAAIEKNTQLQQRMKDFDELKMQNSRNEEQMDRLSVELKQITERLDGVEEDLQLSHHKEADLLHINKEMSESVIILQNELCLLKAKNQAIEEDNNQLKTQNQRSAEKCYSLEAQLKSELDLKHDERFKIAQHLAEQIKLSETTKSELENILGEYEACKQKYSTMVRELQRELQISTQTLQRYENRLDSCSRCKLTAEENLANGRISQLAKECETLASSCTNSYQGSRSSGSSKPSEAIESMDSTQLKDGSALRLKSPSKRHLISRILRLQQAVARQTDKIDFLENHALTLVAELQKKTKVVQYYMLRDHSGALTTGKSDENKSELAKYGSGVMSAIYGGLKASDAKGMTLELSLEINRKLQAVLEDTLLKNITLKENLDVMGLEVDNLTRQLRHLEAKRA